MATPAERVEAMFTNISSGKIFFIVLGMLIVFSQSSLAAKWNFSLFSNKIDVVEVIDDENMDPNHAALVIANAYLGMDEKERIDAKYILLEPRRSKMFLKNASKLRLFYKNLTDLVSERAKASPKDRLWNSLAWFLSNAWIEFAKYDEGVRSDGIRTLEEDFEYMLQADMDARVGSGATKNIERFLTEVILENGKEKQIKSHSWLLNRICALEDQEELLLRKRIYPLTPECWHTLENASKSWTRQKRSSFLEDLNNVELDVLTRDPGRAAEFRNILKLIDFSSTDILWEQVLWKVFYIELAKPGMPDESGLWANNNLKDLTPFKVFNVYQSIAKFTEPGNEDLAINKISLLRSKGLRKLRIMELAQLGNDMTPELAKRLVNYFGFQPDLVIVAAASLRRFDDDKNIYVDDSSTLEFWENILN